MSYFAYAFRLSLWGRLRRPSTRLLLLLAAILTGAALLLPAASSSAVVEVGLVLPRRGGEGLAQLLQTRSSELVRFIPTDEETLDRKILSGDWDCGLVIPEDFEERLEDLDTRRLLVLKTGPGSTVYPLVQETAAACLTELLSPRMAEDYLKDLGLTEDLRPHLAQISQDASRVDLALKTRTGEEMDPLTMGQSSLRSLLTGLLGLLAVIWGLFLSMDLGRWLESGGVQRLRPVMRDTALLLPEASAALAPVTLWGAVLASFLSKRWEMGPGFLLLGAVMLGICLILSRFPKISQALTVGMPFLALFCLIFEPVLVDVSALFPALAPWIRWLPLGLFLRGQWLGLLLEAALLIGLSFAIDWRKSYRSSDLFNAVSGKKDSLS